MYLILEYKVKLFLDLKSQIKDVIIFNSEWNLQIEFSRDGRVVQFKQIVYYNMYYFSYIRKYFEVGYIRK